MEVSDRKMIEYTNEEYKTFLKMVEGVGGLFEYMLRRYVEGEPLLIVQDILTYKSFHDFMKARALVAYPVMYCIPLEEVPMYISEKGILIPAIVKWRLSIGK